MKHILRVTPRQKEWIEEREAKKSGSTDWAAVLLRNAKGDYTLVNLHPDQERAERSMDGIGGAFEGYCVVSVTRYTGMKFDLRVESFGADTVRGELEAVCPHCGHVEDRSKISESSTVACSSCGMGFDVEVKTTLAYSTKKTHCGYCNCENLATKWHDGLDVWICDAHKGEVFWGIYV